MNKGEIKITRSKHYYRPNFIYKGGKYSIGIVDHLGEITMELSHKDKHGNCDSITLYGLSKYIVDRLEVKKDV